MYKFKRTVNNEALEGLGYSRGQKVCIYDSQQVVRSRCRYWTLYYKVYNINTKKMEWVDSFYFSE